MSKQSRVCLEDELQSGMATARRGIRNHVTNLTKI